MLPIPLIASMDAPGQIPASPTTVPAPRAAAARGGEGPAGRGALSLERTPAPALPFTQVPTTLLRASQLPSGARLLYCILCRYSGPDATCHPRQTQLAQALGPETSVRTVQRLLRPLQDAGWITVERSGCHRQYTCNAPVLPGGFVQIPVAVLTAGQLSLSARLLYGLLLSYRGRAGTYPGQARLARDLGVTNTRTVRRLLTELLVAGYLTWSRGGRGRANCYRLRVPEMLRPGADLIQPPATPGAARAPRLDPMGADRETTGRSAEKATPVPAQLDPAELDLPTGVVSKAHARKSVQEPDPLRQQLTPYIQDFARELGDEAPMASSVSRAQNLFEGSGRTLVDFLTVLHQARRVTQQRTAQVRKRQQGAASALAGKNKMPYFFAVLTRLLSSPDSLATAPDSGLEPRHLQRLPVTPSAAGARRSPVATPAAPPVPGPGGAPPYNPLIAGAALEAAQALQEGRAHLAATEVLALWQGSGLAESAFLGYLEQARRQSRPGQGVRTPFRDALRGLVAVAPPLATREAIPAPSGF